jgi:GDP-L-fucose synthase
VGGILANSAYPADFIRVNLQIQTNVIHAAYQTGVKKLMFLGSSCIYPRDCPQPMKEDYLLSGELEATNEPYAVAKIAGIKMCQAYNRQYGTRFISVMPTNLYGPGDNFDLRDSHVLPALIRKFHEGKVTGPSSEVGRDKENTVTIWGTGNPRREFLHVDDLADACLYLMKNYDGNEIINIGAGKDMSIKELALMIQDVVGFKGNLVFDSSKPDGTPQKLLDVSRLKSLGWTSRIPIRLGIEQTYQWLIENEKSFRGVGLAESGSDI